MSKTKTGSNAIFTSAGKGLTIVNDYAYAYSGVLSINNTETTMCQFQSPKGIIVGQTMFNYIANDVEDFMFRVYFNGIQVQGTLQGRHDYDAKFESPVPLIIPPLTEVKLTGQNITNTETHDMIVSLTGKVING
jgi:hypothetical protein